MYCSHARESACVEGWCAKLAKRKQVDVICIVGSVNYKFILVQKKEGRKKGEKKKGKKRDLLLLELSLHRKRVIATYLLATEVFSSPLYVGGVTLCWCSSTDMSL